MIHPSLTWLTSGPFAEVPQIHLIAADVEKEVRAGKGVCLVLSDRKKHCETLKGILHYKFDIHAELLTGDLTTEARKRVLARLEKGEVRVLIATGQLIGEGFDCPDLTTLFMATPIRFSGRVTQYLGRILRLARGRRRPACMTMWMNASLR